MRAAVSVAVMARMPFLEIRATAAAKNGLGLPKGSRSI